MRNVACAQALGTQQLLAYWLDELDEDDTRATEEHLFACAACGTLLERVATLADGVRKLLQQGAIGAVLPASFVQRMKTAGLKIREYRLEPHTSVNCTVTPEDDLVLSHLRAPLEGVHRLDAVLEDVDAGREIRLTDVSFNPSDGEVVYLPIASELRPLQRATRRVRLVSADEHGERTLGVYTFNHRGGG